MKIRRLLDSNYNLKFLMSFKIDFKLSENHFRFSNNKYTSTIFWFSLKPSTLKTGFNWAPAWILKNWIQFKLKPTIYEPRLKFKTRLKFIELGLRFSSSVHILEASCNFRTQYELLWNDLSVNLYFSFMPGCLFVSKKHQNFWTDPAERDLTWPQADTTLPFFYYHCFCKLRSETRLRSSRFFINILCLLLYFLFCGWNKYVKLHKHVYFISIVSLYRAGKLKFFFKSNETLVITNSFN